MNFHKIEALPQALTTRDRAKQLPSDLAARMQGHSHLGSGAGRHNGTTSVPFQIPSPNRTRGDGPCQTTYAWGPVHCPGDGGFGQERMVGRGCRKRGQC